MNGGANMNVAGTMFHPQPTAVGLSTPASLLPQNTTPSPNPFAPQLLPSNSLGAPQPFAPSSSFGQQSMLSASPMPTLQTQGSPMLSAQPQGSPMFQTQSLGQPQMPMQMSNPFMQQQLQQPQLQPHAMTGFQPQQPQMMTGFQPQQPQFPGTPSPGPFMQQPQQQTFGQANPFGGTGWQQTGFSGQPQQWSGM